MILSLIILKNGLEIVAQSDQLDYEPKCHLVNPCTIAGATKVSLKRWPAHAADKHILLRSDDLLTVCEPSKAVTEAYMRKFKLKAEDLEEDLTSDPEPVMLNEQQQPSIEGVPSFEDDYEPRYVEDF